MLVLVNQCVFTLDHVSSVVQIIVYKLLCVFLYMWCLRLTKKTNNYGSILVQDLGRPDRNSDSGNKSIVRLQNATHVRNRYLSI